MGNILSCCTGQQPPATTGAPSDARMPTADNATGTETGGLQRRQSSGPPSPVRTSIELPPPSPPEAARHVVLSEKQTAPEAPIRRLNADEWAQACKDLCDDVHLWKEPASNFAGMASWDARFRDTERMLKNIEERDEVNAAHFLGDRGPVGLMTACKEGMCIEITALVTHPGSTGVGGALVEHAVNHSERAFCSGRVLLQADAHAVGAYEAMGFMKQGFGPNMLLEPSKCPDLWVENDRQWRLRKHVDKPYVTALARTSATS